MFYVAAEILRNRGRTVPFVSAVTAAASRRRDEGKFVLGPVTLCLGILITALLFKGAPAETGIFALVFGDGLASLAGKCFGRVPAPLVRGKTCAGSLACFAAVFASSFAVTGDAARSLITAFAGTALEILPLRDLDNLLIPVGIAGLNTLFSLSTG
ncbi:MAG: phosphatidate cytidylyltransferase [Spirochaetaceae bacterium]|nr:phosphatidate cytidylyltransferase [Spirochaetaceae bacterium]